MYRSPNTVRMTKSAVLIQTGHVTRMQEARSPFKSLTSKPTEKRPLGRSRRRRVGLQRYVSPNLLFAAPKGDLTSTLDIMNSRSYQKISTNSSFF